MILKDEAEKAAKRDIEILETMLARNYVEQGLPVDQAFARAKDDIVRMNEADRRSAFQALSVRGGGELGR